MSPPRPDRSEPDKLRIFLSHSWDDNFFADLIYERLTGDGKFEVWLDQRNIVSGQSIHARISTALTECDCFVALLSPASLASNEVLEEIIRADERGLGLCALVDRAVADKLPACVGTSERWTKLHFDPNSPDDVADQQGIPAIVDKLVEHLTRLASSEHFRALSRSNREIFRIARHLQVLRAEPDFRSEMARAIVQSITRELRGILGGEYVATIGLDRSFLLRAGPLYAAADRITAVSLHSISEFWGNTVLEKDVDTFIAAQGPHTIRLFAFPSREAANRQAGMLRRHVAKYGSAGGAVLLCSTDTYRAQILPAVAAHPDHIPSLLRQDFALLEFVPDRRSSFKVETVLSASHVRVREIVGDQAGAIRYTAFQGLLTQLEADSNPCVRRLSSDSFEGAQWPAVLDQVFGAEGGEVVHLLMIQPQMPEDDVSDVLSAMKSELLAGLSPGARPLCVWIGRRRQAPPGSAAHTAAAWQPPAPGRPYLVLMRFTSREHLRTYYKDPWHSTGWAPLYGRLHSHAEAWLRPDTLTELPTRRRARVFVAAEDLLSRFMERMDYFSEAVITAPLPTGGEREDGTEKTSPAPEPLRLLNLIKEGQLGWFIEGTVKKLVEQKVLADPDTFRGLEDADCVLAYISASSMTKPVALEQLVRAHERGLVILPVFSQSDPALRPPQWLSDLAYIAELGQRQNEAFRDHLQRSLRKIGCPDVRGSIRQRSTANDRGEGVVPAEDVPLGAVGVELLMAREHRSFMKLARDVREEIGTHPFKGAMIADLLADVEREISGIVRNSYETAIGSAHAYLQRAGELFRLAVSACAVSRDAISAFWTADVLQEEAERYLGKQPSHTVRLFVFSGHAAAQAHRALLTRHYERYGKEGAVLFCSQADYDRLVGRIAATCGVDARAIGDSDFARLEFEARPDGRAVIVATLTRFELKFTDVNEQRTPPAVKLQDATARQLSDIAATLSAGRFSEEHRIGRWGPSTEEEWPRHMEQMFQHHAAPDCVHVAFWPHRDASRAQRAATAAATLAHEHVWNGARISVDVADASSGGLIDTGIASIHPVLFLTSLRSPEEAENYDTTVWRPREVNAVHRALDPAADRWSERPGVGEPLAELVSRQVQTAVYENIEKTVVDPSATPRA